MVHNVTRIRTNGSHTSLDLVLAEDGIITSCTVIAMGISDHFPVLTTVPLAAMAAADRSTIRFGRDFRKSSMHEISQALASSGLEDFSSAMTLERMWEQWFQRLLLTLDRFVPVRKCHVKTSHKMPTPWKTPAYY
eukprot:scpid108689/ scgid19142/ 